VMMFNDLRTLTILHNLHHCPYTDWHHKVFATAHNKRTRHWWDDSWVIQGVSGGIANILGGGSMEYSE
jgi:hypothetical protein